MDNKKKNIIILALLVMTPLMGVMLLLIKYQARPWDLYLPASLWNDELLYYKQIEAVIDHGMPRGYFGYNESKALIGTFGPWSLALLVPYCILFRLVGIGYYRIFAVNILLWIVTLFLVYKKLRLTVKDCIFLSLLWIADICMPRYVLSVCPEAIVAMLELLFLVNVLKCNETYDSEENSSKTMLISQIIMMILIFMRGYYVVMGILPLSVSIKHKDKKGVIFSIFSMISGCVGYVFLTHFFECPYFWSLVNTDIIKEIFITPIEGIKHACILLHDAFFLIRKNVLEIFGTGSMVGVLYLISIILIILLFVTSVYYKNQLCAAGAVAYSLIIIQMILLYDVRSGSRHLLASTFAFGVLYIYLNRNGLVRICFITLFALCMWFGSTDDAVKPPLPEASSNLKNSIASLDKALEEKMKQYEDPWDNTLLWTLSIDFRELYALPSWMGINICFDNYVTDNCESLKARFVAVDTANEQLNETAKQMGWALVASTDRIYIYAMR